MENNVVSIATVIGAIFTVIAVIIQLLRKDKATTEMKQSGIGNKQTIDTSNHSVTINMDGKKDDV